MTTSRKSDDCNALTDPDIKIHVRIENIINKQASAASN